MAKGVKEAVASIVKEKVISAELRKLLSRDVEVLPRDKVTGKGEGRDSVGR